MNGNESLTTTEIKKQNCKKVFDYLYQNQRTSKQTIAQALGLSMPTVSQNLKLLEGAGCTVLAIPCNTSHYFADRLQAQLHVPIIHMIRETVKTIQAMGKQTVGILATDGTVQTGIYQNELTAAGLTPVTLPEELQKTVMSIIYDEIKKGETGSREKFGEIDAYLRSVGCDCAILGCTELSVYRTLHSLPPFYIDAMEILAEQAILRCGKQLRNV